MHVSRVNFLNLTGIQFYKFHNWIQRRPKIPRGSLDVTVNKLQHDKRRGKKMKQGRGSFSIKNVTQVGLSGLYVCRWLRLVLEKTSDLLTLVFSVMKSHKTINPANYTTVQDVFPFLGLKYSRAYELTR